MKIKIKCKKCSWEAEVEVSGSPIGQLKPGEKVKGAGIKIKLSKDQLDKIMDAAGGHGASKDELADLGLPVPIPEWQDAIERRRLREFVKKHLKVSKEQRRAEGEKSQVSTAPWQMGDSFKDVDLASSEVKAMGVDDLRLIPGVTLQKRVYETTRGQDREILKGIKFFNIIDVSGSMFSSDVAKGKVDKVHKALLMAEESWKLCKQLGYDYYLAIFSDKGTRVPQKKTKKFFEEEEERRKYPGWNGGTVLTSALELFDLKELKDGNLVIMSDMDIADFEATQKKLEEIGAVTNSFKVVIIENASSLNDTRVTETQKLFQDKKVEILKVVV